MQHLVAYVEGHVDELVDDLVPALREADPIFRECEPLRLREGLRAALLHFTQYVDQRSPQAVDACLATLRALWPPDRFLQSVMVRVLFQFEDLVAIRAQVLYADLEEFIDALRALRAAMREALCAVADALQGRHTTWETDRRTMPMESRGTSLGRDDPVGVGADQTPIAGDIEARLPSLAARGSLLDRLDAVRPVARADELRQIWARLRAVAAREGGGHQVVGIKAPDGFGKSTLVQTFIERVRMQLGRPPAVFRTRAPRLFDLPQWPVVALLRGIFGAPLGVPGNRARIEALLHQLEGLRTRAPVDAEALLLGLPYLDALVGAGGDVPAEPSSRTVGIHLRRALVALFEALSLRARIQTGGPLFLVFEDAGEMDGPSWDLVEHLIRTVRPAAPLMVLLTYDGRFSAPPRLARMPNFTEVILQHFDMNEGEQLIDALLEPNRLDDGTRLRLNAGAQGSPLLLHEAVRQLVADGVIGWEGEAWVEIARLPGGELGDLGTIVERRLAQLEGSAPEVLDVVAVVEDTADGVVLEEVTARRAIGREELLNALAQLQRAGLVETTMTERGIVARTRHPLVRDQIYRRMGQERRRAIHEDAGEVFLHLPEAQAYPTLAASHLALANWPTRALHGLVAGIDRAVRWDNMAGALELCSQGLGLLKGLAPDDHDRFLFAVLSRRERIFARLGQFEARAADLRQIAALVDGVGTPQDRERLVLVEAAQAVFEGRHSAAEERLLPALGAREADSVLQARARLALALNCWQQGQRAEARIFLDEAFDEAGEDAEPRLRTRLLHTRGLFHAGGGQVPEALRDLFGAWRAAELGQDLYGEALVVAGLAELYWSMGRLLDALKLLRRAESILAESGAPRAESMVLLKLGELHALLGDFDEANQLFAAVLRPVDKGRERLVHAAAVIGQGRILVNRGRFDDAVSLLGLCLKDLGRQSKREPLYVDALLALAMNFATFARGEKLVSGGLRYAGEAADRAMEIGYLRGLVQALVIQLRGLVVLDRAGEAKARLGELDAAMHSALEHDPRLARLQAEVELCRYQVFKAVGDDGDAEDALDAAWDELHLQVACLRGSGYERGFLNNIFQNREIVMAKGEPSTSQAPAAVPPSTLH